MKVKFVLFAVCFFLFLPRPALCAELTGRVVFEGKAPPAQPVEVKSDVATCGKAKEIKNLVLGERGGVAGAVVTVVNAQGEPKRADGSLDQAQCEFVPAIQVVPLGSLLKITSSDPVLHNAHGFYEDGSTAFNIAVPVAGMELPIPMDKPGVIKLRCDAGHTWMKAFVIVTDQPFYAVTDANGNFKIDGLPAGEYEAQVWQEWTGVSKHTVQVGDTGTAVTLTIKKS